MPIFSLSETADNKKIEHVSPKIDAAKAEVKPTTEIRNTQLKIGSKSGSLFSPSIKSALAGKSNETDKKYSENNSDYSVYEQYSEVFTKEQLAIKWLEFQEKISDRPNLRSTLSLIPEIVEAKTLILKIGNSIQEEEVRMIKPELIAFLRRELRNSDIELITKLEKLENERVLFSDSEKMQSMINKNPALMELKQKFNLDFS